MKPPDINVLGEALLYLLDGLSFLAVIFALYSSDLAYPKDERKERRARIQSKLRYYGGAFLFVTLLIVAGATWHTLVDTSMHGAALTVVVAFFALALIHFYFLREHVSEATRYAFIIWGAAGLVIAFLIAMIAFSKAHFGLKLAKENELEFEHIINLFNTFGQIGGIVIAASMVVVTNRANSRQAVKSARSEIYQTLELASIEFFRFECRETELVTGLYFPEKLPEERRIDPVFDHQFRQYLYQNLNLFEMACRFRKEEVMEASIFGSWVIWIWNLGSNPVFIHHWQRDDAEMSLNYVGELFALIEAAISVSRNAAIPKADKESAFFKEAAAIVEPDIPSGCPAIMAFYARLQTQKAESAAALSSARN